MAKEKRNNPGYILIRGVGKVTKSELENIAANLEMNLTEFLKPKLKEIINSYPVEMRIKPLQD